MLPYYREQFVRQALIVILVHVCWFFVIVCAVGMAAWLLVVRD